MAHSNLNKLPAGPADEGMQVEAAEDENPPPVLSAAAETPTRVPVPAIPGAPQPPMRQMPPPPLDLRWLDIILALVMMPPVYPGVIPHPYTRSNLPGWRGVVRYKNLRSHHPCCCSSSDSLRILVVNSHSCSVETESLSFSWTSMMLQCLDGLICAAVRYTTFLWGNTTRVWLQIYLTVILCICWPLLHSKLPLVTSFLPSNPSGCIVCTSWSS